MTLTEWAQRVCAELELTDQRVGSADVDRILDLAKDAAHSVARPAAPLTTYLVGIAVGRGADPERAAALVAELARAQVSSEED
ncbi:DUF6457 domain-containing protein [Salinactinospora qingdaonensis]|uniref:DUF6457 domain-containing protein n=1 Tax=Salinactinospora qingdaonensis TaxID=702744 RepID=A0ABP7EYD5_9ACTN